MESPTISSASTGPFLSIGSSALPIMSPPAIPTPLSPAAAAPVTPAPAIEISGVEKSALYRIGPGHAVETLWSSTEENAYDLVTAGRSVIFSTDKQGRLYQLGPVRKVTLLTETNESEALRLLPLTRSLLVARGVKLDRSAPNTIVLCGPQWSAEPAASGRRGVLTQRGLRVLQAGPYRRLYVGDHWIEDPWAGLILVEREGTTVAGTRRVYVFGFTHAGLCAAVRRLASLRALRDYLTAPFAPLRSGAE